jgi:hypothetical protein
MAQITDYLVTEKARLTAMEALRASPGALLGVSPEAVEALEDLAIPTVFDLAASRIFANATLLLEAATDPASMLARFGIAPADVLEALPPGVSLDQLRNQPISILDGIGTMKAAKLSKALSVSTVRDLALWPPYLTARHIVRAVFHPDQTPDGDADAPADLLPKSGEFPTDRVFYSTLVFDGFEGDPGQLTPLNGQVSVNPISDDTFGFTKPGVGALLTVSQSWYAQGVALGNLLHSVALAPGESTRIAMIDWSRRSTGKQDEAVSEAESLSNVTEHKRAISEVTSAVARESQAGFSETEAKGFSGQSGSATGISFGGLNIGESGGFATSDSRAKTFSSSFGRRDLSATMTQNVVDRTQQHANASRNRRATVVKEISQTERDQVSSRVVTNYNHMHALSVQYYEIVQIYRVSVALTRVEKCLFIPMALIDFGNPALVRHFKNVLRHAAIDLEGAAMLAMDMDTVLIKGPAITANSVLSLVNPWGEPAEVRDGGKTLAITDEARLTSIRVWSGPHNKQLSDIVVQLRDGSKADLQQSAKGTYDTTYLVIDRPALREIAAISMAQAANYPSGNNEYLTEFFLNNGKLTIKCNLLITPSLPVTALALSGGGVWQKVVDHLTANRLYYSQAVLRSLDPSTVTLLLAKYSYKGRPVTEQIDPQPVTIAGNYLVFKMPVSPNADNHEGKAWKQWLDDHGVSFNEVKEDLVPLPSGGVFAEAVLGRYNSAEKLDITRFWNWQDSPIPIVAPEIAPLQLGSRATEEDLKAQPLSPSILNIVNPTSLPDPVGMSGVLQAIQNGNMFRDMSGLAATIGLAQAGMQTMSDAATAANVQAGSNMATAAKKEVEVFKAALAFAGAMMGKGAPDTSPSTISNDGARINHGRSMDTRGVPGPSGTATSGVSTPVTGGSSGSGSVSVAGPGSSGGGGTGSGSSVFAYPQTGGYSHEAAYANRSAFGYSPDAVNAVVGSPDNTAVQATPVVFGRDDVEAVQTYAANWADLLQFQVPSSIVTDLAGRNMKVQNFDDAIGDLNLDFYPVKITKMPTVNGTQVDAAGLLEHVRRNLNDFVNTFYSTFSPYQTPTDSVKWESASPLGAVIKIDIPGPDNAAVVTSLAEGSRWRFSTIRTPNTGSHPVSGNREFGFRTLDDGSTVFFTRGADRTSETGETIMDFISYGAADKLWLSLPEKIAQFVNANGGTAVKLDRFSRRFKWSLVRIILRLPDRTVTTV